MKFNLFAFKGTAILMSIFILVATNCKKDVDFPFTLDPEEVDSILTKIQNDSQCMDFYLALKQLPYLQLPTPIPSPTNVGDPVITQNGVQKCTEQKVKYAPEYNELYLLDPKSDVIYVSAPMDATSVNTGAYAPLSNIQRGPVSISISLLTQPGTKPYQIVDEPSLSTIRDAINNLLHDVSPGSTPAFINFDIQEVRSAEEVELGIQANFKGWGVKVSGSYDFASTEKKSRFLLRFSQKYYSIDMDLPNTPCDFFKPGEMPDVGDFVGVSPVYVSSVTYGRMVYFMIESSSSAEEMKTALSVAVKRWGMGASLDLNYAQKQMIEQSKMSALIVGGNADAAVKSVSGLNDMINFITSEGDFSATAPGVPIAYTMRYLKDNSVARIVLNSEYTIRNCEDVPPTTETFTPGDISEIRLNHISGDTEFDGYGPVVNFDCTLSIENDGREVLATIHLNMKEEPQGYTTQGDIVIEKILWTCPENSRISEITSANEFNFNYTDTDTSMETFDFPASDIVKRLELKGDTGGGDLDQSNIEEEAHLHLMKFNPIMVSVVPR